MNFPVPRSRKEKKQMMIDGFTTGFMALEERFAEVDKIIDPADRLLMLRKLENDMQAFGGKRRFFIKEQANFPAIVTWGGFLTGAGVAGAAGFLLLGPFGAGLGIVGGAVAAVFGEGALKEKRRVSLENKMELSTRSDLWSRVAASRDDIIENADILAFAQSSHAVTAFTQFPQLKEKFLLAVEVNKVQESQKDDRPLGLDKPKPASGDVRL